MDNKLEAFSRMDKDESLEKNGAQFVLEPQLCLTEREKWIEIKYFASKW